MFTLTVEIPLLAMAGEGWRTTIERFPDAARPDLLARVRIDGRAPTEESVRQEIADAGRRHTERRPFRPHAVSAKLLDTLCAVIADPILYAAVVLRPDDRLDLAVAMSWADGLELRDPAYRAELATWVRPDAAEAGEGISSADVPQAAPGRPRHTDVPLRDFTAGSPPPAVPPGAPEIDEHPAYVVVFSRDDDPTARLRAGEAYTRLSVEAERLGLATSAMTQALDLPAVRNRVRTLMSWPDHPQMILRVGWPPAGDVTPRTTRLPVADVLTF